MNTRKDYWRAVAIVRAYTPNPGRHAQSEHDRAILCAAFADFFSSDNARFDDERFTAAVWAKEGK